MTCAELEERLAVAPLDTLDAAERAALAAHTEGCPPCTERLRALEAAYAWLEDAVSEEEEPLPAALRERIVAAAEEGRAPAATATKKPASGPKRIALSCSYCHGELPRGLSAFCAGCLAPHHADCFEEHGRCSAMGCGETRLIRREAIVAAARPRRRLASAIGFAAGLLVGALAGAGTMLYQENIHVTYDSKSVPIDVPVATRDLKPGEVVTKADITIQQFPYGVIDALGGTHFAANESDRLEGARVLAPIRAGQVFQGPHFVRPKITWETARDPLTGTWDGGAEWGEVIIEDGRGVYSANRGTGQGRLVLHDKGERVYSGTWGESAQRHGTLELTVAPDRSRVAGTWRAVAWGSSGPSSGTLAWTPRKESLPSGPEPIVGGRGALVAKRMEVLVEGLVGEIWLNGLPLPDAFRHTKSASGDARLEELAVDLREGDWLVFEVATDHSRVGRAFFGASAFDPAGAVAFATRSTGGWFACDDIERLGAFVSLRDGGTDRFATAAPSSSAAAFNTFLDGTTGEPIWGKRSTTWLKCVVSQAR